MIDPEIIKRFEQLASLIRQVQGALGGRKVVCGVVDGTGTATILEGEGFTLTDNGTGDYTLTFTEPFTDRPSVNVWPVGGARASTEHASSPADGTGVRLITFTTTTGANVDTPFHFIAIGPT